MTERFIDDDQRGRYKPPASRVDCEQVRFEDFFQPPPSKDVLEKCAGFYGFLVDAKQKHQYLYRRTLYEGSSARVIVFDRKAQREREMIMMASNSYLDLTCHPQVVAAAREAQERFGYGAGGVPLLSGTYEPHRRLEARIASFHGREDAVLFPTGYAANLGTLQALTRPGDLAVLDMYAHASIVDGATLAGATTKYFRHGDVAALDELCRRLRPRFEGLLVATDGVFSMDGDVCRLPELLEVTRRHGGRLLVDEAHALGTLGPNGKGTEDHFGLPGSVDLLVGTLSKAPGGLGGYVAGSREVVEYLRHFANAHVFSTALPPPVVAGLLAAFDVIEHDGARRQRLSDNARYFTSRLRDRGFDVGPTQTPIVPVILGDEVLVRRVALDLDEAGVFASPVVYPAVLRGQGRIRFGVMATHTREDLDQVVAALEASRERHAR